MTMFNGFMLDAAGGGGSSGGTGDVVGPGSATDNAVARFDATTGKLIQNSSITISDVSGVTTTVATVTPAATTGATAAGRALAITASPAVASTDTAGAAAGGAVTITAGAAARNTSGNANGGDINLTPGAGIGTGVAGNVVVSTDVTANNFLAAQALYAGGITTATSEWVVDQGKSYGSSVFHYGWVSAGTPEDSSYVLDTGLARQSAGVVRVTNGTTGIGAILNSRLVEANTAGSGSPNILALTESGTILTNEGATAENYHTLPTAVAGYVFTFVVQDTDGIRIKASAGDTIRPIAGTAASATGGFIRCATAGAFITLASVNATEWISIGSAGVWTIDV